MSQPAISAVGVVKDRAAWVNAILRLLVGGVFVSAALFKIADPANFALAIANYRLAPHALNNLIAVLLPWIEVLSGMLVLTGIWLRAAALVIASLTAIFTLAIVSALMRGLNIECGCFGTVGGRHIGLFSLLLDTTLFSLATLLAIFPNDCPASKIPAAVHAPR
jgi:uncharacterized membrane protein YphA (DoxX/SURF4 family)